tara:strand:- start:203 stop:2980 length:2778 start_codon:yes stop_codon:yes gene_type:complete
MNLFSALKNTRPKNGVSNELFHFCLIQEEDHYFLTILDEKGERIKVQAGLHGGYEGEVISFLQRMQNRSTSGWDLEGPQVSLMDHPEIFTKLKNCKNVFWEDGSSVDFKKEDYSMSVDILEPKEEMHKLQVCLTYPSKPSVLIDSDYEWLADGYLKHGSSIYTYLMVGNHFNQLGQLSSLVSIKEIPQILSLLFSYFRNLNLSFCDYQIEENQIVNSVPTVALEEVEEDQNLIFKVIETLPSVENISILTDFNLHYWVQLNHAEKKVQRSAIDHVDILKVKKDLLKKLRASCRRIKEADFDEIDSLFVLNNIASQLFVTEILPKLLEDYRVVGAEYLSSFKVRRVQPNLRLNLNSGIQYIDGSASLEVEGEEFSLYEFIKKADQQSYIVLKDGSKGLINTSYIDRLKRLLHKVDKNGKVSISFFDLPFIEDLIEERGNGNGWELSQSFYQGFNDYTKLKIPKVLANLRDYQKSGIRWLLYLKKFGFGGCLADDMGLGKTLQAIALLLSSYPNEKKSSLVVMPRSLLFNWANELEKFAPTLTYYRLHGQNKNLTQAMNKNLILTTYGTCRGMIEELKEVDFHYLVLDESQNIKNVQSQTSKAAMLLKSDHRIALSGTPVENNLGELYALFRFLNPGMFGSLKDFQQNYLLPIQQFGDPEVTDELKTKISPFIMRRLKQEVLKDLPEKVEQHLYVEMSEEQDKIYKERQSYFHKLIQGSIAKDGLSQSQFVLFQALSELRQLASIPEAKVNLKKPSAKRELLKEQINEAIANGHKVLVFVNFLSAMEYLVSDFEQQKISCLTMSGQTRDRQGVVDRFQNDPSVQVLVMTLKTGGVGLNLTSADMVYIFDPWWNVAAENQAIDRTHRMGQKKTVFCYRMITKNTIEDKILQLQNQKKELLDNLLSGDEGITKKLSEEDIDFILEGGRG